MSGDYDRGDERVDWFCPACGNAMPLYAGREACALDDRCCGECYARCFETQRCAKIDNDPFWTKLEGQLAKIGTRPPHEQTWPIPTKKKPLFL